MASLRLQVDYCLNAPSPEKTNVLVGIYFIDNSRGLGFLMALGFQAHVFISNSGVCLSKEQEGCVEDMKCQNSNVV